MWRKSRNKDLFQTLSWGYYQIAVRKRRQLLLSKTLLWNVRRTCGERRRQRPISRRQCIIQGNEMSAILGFMGKEGWWGWELEKQEHCKKHEFYHAKLFKPSYIHRHWKKMSSSFCVGNHSGWMAGWFTLTQNRSNGTKHGYVFPFILLKPFLEAIDTLGQFWARTDLLTLNWEEEVVTLESMVTIEIKEIEMGEADVVRFGGERSWLKVSVACKLTLS